MFIEFDGIINARDLGGIKTADGRKVKSGLLLRGAGLYGASDADIERLSRKFRIRHIMDFRDIYECRRQPDRAVPGAEYHNRGALPALPGDPPREGGETDPDFDPVFREIYRLLAVDDCAGEAYREFFRLLLESGGEAIYWHCTQGKDRTGVASLLLLTALGVEFEDAMEDYYLSNQGLMCKYKEAPPPGVRPWSEETRGRLFFVFPEYIGIFLELTEQLYGGLEGYLRTNIGLDDSAMKKLREYYTEEV